MQSGMIIKKMAAGNFGINEVIAAIVILIFLYNIRQGYKKGFLKQAAFYINTVIALVLVPLLSGWCGMEGKRSFATCVAVILPLSAVSAAVYLLRQGFEPAAALPYLLGGLAGGLVGGRLFRCVSVEWLRGLFAAFLVYGGVRYLL